MMDNELAGFDAYMDKVLLDWNAPGIGVAMVTRDRMVFAKGWGYRDYGKRLPFTPQTVVPIASNTKLFTAVAAGMLVEEGKLSWDTPIKLHVPTIRFYNDQLDATITLRDMLGHRTGVTRHDCIWYKSDITRKELFERLRYLEPKESLRQLWLYNNVMYACVGYIMELLSGRSWEAFVKERIFEPLGMAHSVFSTDALLSEPDHAVPWTERRDSSELYEIPHYREQDGVGPAGSIQSNLEDLSKWVMALLNHGKFGERQVIPAAVLKETQRPAIAQANSMLEMRGWSELLNPVYGAGCRTACYRGHLLRSHGGFINGFSSQVATLPNEGCGVVVLTIGNHAAPLSDVVAYHLVERVLGLSPTPWSERHLEIRRKGMNADHESRAKSGELRVSGTQPAHPLEAYVGEYEHPAYGVLAIAPAGGELEFVLHKIRLPLTHFHYERFDTPDDEEAGKWSVNFVTSPLGDVDRVLISLDQGEVTFTRRAPSELWEPPTLARYVGTYQTPTGANYQVVLKEHGMLAMGFPGDLLQTLRPWKPHKFRVREFSDIAVEFVVQSDRVTAIKLIEPSGPRTFVRR